MKKIVLLLAFLLGVNVLAQENQIDVKIERSKVFKDKGKWDIETILESKDKSVFTIRTQLTGLFSPKPIYLFNKFDKNYNKILSYKHKPKKNHSLASAAVTEESFYFVEYKKDKKNKKIIAYINVSPLDKFKFEKKEIFSLDVAKFPGFFSSLFSGARMDTNLHGNLSFSENGNYKVFNIDSYSKKKEQHSLIVLDRHLNELWRKDIKLDIEDDRFELESIKVSNTGDVFVLGKARPAGKVKTKKDKRNYHYQLLKINENETKTVDLSVEDHFVGSLNLTFTNNNKIGCLGFYSDRNDYRYKGISSFFINPDNLKIESKNFSPFTDQFLVDKYGKVKKKELSNVVLRDVYYSDNGDITFTAEEFYITVYTTFGANGVSTTRTIFNFDDIMVIKTDNLGTLKWARNINKRQSSGNYSDSLLSFSSIINDNGNVFLFLNAHKNMGEMSGNRIKFRQGWLSGVTKKNSNMYVVKFDDKGEWKFQTIQKNKKATTIINSRFMQILDQNKLVFYGSHKNNKQFITLTF